MTHREHGRRYAIASSLLGEHNGLGWSNLGDWSSSDHGNGNGNGNLADYHTACRHLALLHGQAAKLRADDRVLDLGCGLGASLQLWPEAFGVGSVMAVEHQTACVAAIQRAAPDALQAIHAARFDCLPLPDGLPAQAFDAALCVDAAYHARSLTDFAHFAAAAVRPGGRLAFSTLMPAPAFAQAPRHRQTRLRYLLALAGIPRASLRTSVDLRQDLTMAGWQDIEIRPLTNVLGGFADFVAQRATALPWPQRLTPGWQKIAMTARLCRQLMQGGLVSYVLVQAIRREASPVPE